MLEAVECDAEEEAEEGQAEFRWGYHFPAKGQANIVDFATLLCEWLIKQGRDVS